MTLTVQRQLSPGKPASADAVRDLLRDRVGEEISVTAGKAGIFLYAATADAAETAAHTAQVVLAQHGLAADIRLERWDPSRRSWLDALPEPPAAELTSGQQENPGRRRLRSAGALIAAVIDAIGADGGP